MRRTPSCGNLGLWERLQPRLLNRPERRQEDVVEPTSQPARRGPQGRRRHGCWGPCLDRGKRALVSPCPVQMRPPQEGFRKDGTGWPWLGLRGRRDWLSLGQALDPRRLQHLGPYSRPSSASRPHPNPARTLAACLSFHRAPPGPRMGPPSPCPAHTCSGDFQPEKKALRAPLRRPRPHACGPALWDVHTQLCGPTGLAID